MDNDSFERQVQLKLNGQELQPSPAAWERIESRIREGRPSRRRWLLLWLLAGLGAGGLGVWIFHAGKSGHLLSQKHFVSRGVSPVAGLETRPPAPATGDASRNPVKIVPRPVIRIPQVAGFNRDNTPGGRLPHRLETVGDVANGLTLPVTRKKRVGPLYGHRPGRVSRIDGTVWKGEIDPGMTRALVSPEHPYLPASPVADAGPHVSLRANNKWTWQIVFIPGISGTGSHFLSLGGSTPQSFMNLSGSSGGSYAAVTPSAVKAAAGFTAGVLVQRSTRPGSRLSVVSGLQFMLFNGRQVVLVDNAARPSVQAGTPQTRSYHTTFITLPAILEYHLMKGSHGHLAVMGGLTLSAMTGSDALQLNYNSGYYYPDNSLFHRFQAGMDLGVNWELFPAGKLPLNIGPYLWYGLTAASATGLYKGAHFGFAGIRFAGLLKK